MNRQKLTGRRAAWRPWAAVIGAGAMTLTATYVWSQEPAAPATAPATAPAGAGQPAPADAAGSVTDAQVVAAMEKGIDCLLRIKKGDNWENGGPWSPASGKTGNEVGGGTGLALYALLHASESLQDDPEYRAKLNWRGKELSPVVAWLEKNVPDQTYAAALEASALTMLPKIPGQRADEGPQKALNACRAYLIAAMGIDGGYTYSAVKGADHLDELWEAYFTARGEAARTDAKKALDAFVRSIMALSASGAQEAIQQLVTELRKKAQANPSEAARIEQELTALETYSKNLPEPAKKGKKEIAKEKETDKDGKGKFKPLGDLSNTQYGTLGAWALMDYGMEMPNAYWTVTDRFWRLLQKENGSWPYLVNPDAAEPPAKEDTMGTAGIASLFICQEFVDTELRLTPKPDKNIDAALAWLTREFKPNSDNLYYMYGIERVGLASGLKFFGTTNWYKEGAADIVRRQGADGSWHSDFNGGHYPVISTSYALLFLARGRNPVVFNKLQYNGPWNARSHDDAYVTRWMSKRFEKPINWQVVNLQVSPDEWQDAPILLITGSADPHFTPADIAKIKAFINAGGMVFSTADGDTPAFTAAIKKYASAIADNKYEMRQLPRNHPLFSKELDVDLPNPPPLLGMSNGERELWIHSTTDVGADWETRRFSSKNFDLAAALYFYASSRGSLRTKLQPLVVNPGTDKPARTIELARLDYAGNADPEPGAWPRMAKLARANFKTQVDLMSIPFATLDAKKYSLAHLTGTTHITFTDDEVKALKAYLDAGGLLFIDAGGGNPDFAASARDLIKQLYPHNPIEALPGDHPIYTGAMPDGAPVNVKFRPYGDAVLHRHVTKGALECVVVNGRTRILLSSWDITSGFLGTNTWGILGYTPETAQALARNILLYSQNPAQDVIKEKDATAVK